MLAVWSETLSILLLVFVPHYPPSEPTKVDPAEIDPTRSDPTKINTISPGEVGLEYLRERSGLYRVPSY